ncbi:MAG: AbrB/MazE/SpoVT family DNA-binding domain-containing protein [Oscillospiraceae bacterium]|nr:AbrB/MazE/SpoVT family DNA-binding domain-containing protein [Oscillospiraceae bacterium]
MNVTGVIRRVDNLGRIVVPAEMRKVLNIVKEDAIEVFMDSGMICLRKFDPNRNNCKLLVDDALKALDNEDIDSDNPEIVEIRRRLSEVLDILDRRANKPQ